MDGEGVKEIANLALGARASEATGETVDYLDIVDDKVPLVLKRGPDGISTTEVFTQALEIMERRREIPRALVEKQVLTEVDSFTAYINRFKNSTSAVFADAEAVKLRATIDYHAPSGDGLDDENQRWCRHTATYACPLSDAWKRWIGSDGVVMQQDQFADFVEANISDLTSPPKDAVDVAQPAAVVEMARRVAVITKGTFERTVNVNTGESTLINRVENESTTSTKIYRAFALKLQVFRGGAFYFVEARIRFQLAGGRPTFAYVLHEPTLVRDHAFDEVRAKVKEETGLPIFAAPVTA